MRIANEWEDFEVLDASCGEKLERWGDVVLIRPDPQAIWETQRDQKLWGSASGRYLRSEKGGGTWDFRRTPPESWQIKYKHLTFLVRPTGFKHTGLFPEQAVNWDLLARLIKGAVRPVSVLNLFAYTGGATLACAAAGAQVCHVDASKGMVDWARQNAALSGLGDKPVRWIVDDCRKFIEKELRRSKQYDAVIMDPPSYGRGPSGELWKLEDCIYDLLELCKPLISNNPLFFALNSYTTGLSPSVMACLLKTTVAQKAKLSADEIGLPVAGTGCPLPCGGTALAVYE